jgi:L-iditol 2-dehydrogenase
MKAALMRSPGVLEVTEVEDRVCPEGGALLKVMACAVCGTDVKMLYEGHRDLVYPRIPGHEVTAEVLEVDADSSFRKGDRVQIWPGESCGICAHCRSGNDHLCPSIKIMGFNMDGGMAEMLAVRDLSRMVPIGKADAVHLTLAEPLACCINAQEKLGVGKGDIVLIMGGGPMGCLNAYLARRNGADRVFVTEPQARRLQEAPKGLFDRISSPEIAELRQMIDEGTGGSGVDVIIPCTSNVRLDRDVLKMLAPGGRLCVFCGPHRDDSPLPMDVREMHYRELTVVGSYGNSSGHNRSAVRMLTGDTDLSWLLTGRYRLDQVQEAFDSASARKGLKAVMTF